MLAADNFIKTPLYDQHLALKARLVEFSGWLMPVSYEGILEEYKVNRQSVSVFDICHMGEFIIDGDCCDSGLNNIVTCAIESMPIKTCKYGTILNEHGGVIDDLIVYRIEQNKWMIVVNAANIDKDSKHFQKHLNTKATFKDVSFETGKIDVQGPQSRDVLGKMIEGIEELKYYTFDYFDLLDEKVIVSRTGYTGELGYEIYCPWKKTELLWKNLINELKIKPSGLGVRDVLRVEMGYSLYGHELNEDISPLEAGLKRNLDMTKDFVGKDALLLQDKDQIRKLIYFISDTRRSPRHQNKIFNSDNEEIGMVTSGTFSPSLQKGIGIGLVNKSFSSEQEVVYFGNEKNKALAQLTGRQFYKNNSLKN